MDTFEEVILGTGHRVMAKKKRKKYTDEFKREAVRLMLTRGDRTVSDVAQSVGVTENLSAIT